MLWLKCSAWDGPKTSSRRMWTVYIIRLGLEISLSCMAPPTGICHCSAYSGCCMSPGDQQLFRCGSRASDSPYTSIAHHVRCLCSVPAPLATRCGSCRVTLNAHLCVCITYADQNTCCAHSMTCISPVQASGKTHSAIASDWCLHILLHVTGCQQRRAFH